MLLLPIAYSNQHTGCENIRIYQVEVVTRSTTKSL